MFGQYNAHKCRKARFVSGLGVFFCGNGCYPCYLSYKLNESCCLPCVLGGGTWLLALRVKMRAENNIEVCTQKVSQMLSLKPSVINYIWKFKNVHPYSLSLSLSLSLSRDNNFVKCLMWYFQGSILNDFYTSCCCAECVMCQLSREHDFVTSQAMTYWWQSNTLCILWLWYSADSIMCQYYSNIRPSSFIPDIGNLNAPNSSFLFVLFSWINYPWKNLQYQMNVLQ